MGTFAEADEFSVTFHIAAGGNAFQAQHGPAAEPGFRQGEIPFIYADRRVVRDAGRIIGNGIADVGILGNSVALQLPDAGYLNGSGSAGSGTAGKPFHLPPGGKPGEVPASVQGAEPGAGRPLSGQGGCFVLPGNQGGAHGQPVESGDGKILKFVAHTDSPLRSGMGHGIRRKSRIRLSLRVRWICLGWEKRKSGYCSRMRWIQQI